MIVVHVILHTYTSDSLTPYPIHLDGLPPLKSHPALIKRNPHLPPPHHHSTLASPAKDFCQVNQVPTPTPRVHRHTLATVRNSTHHTLPNQPTHPTLPLFENRTRPTPLSNREQNQNKRISDRKQRTQIVRGISYSAPCNFVKMGICGFGSLGVWLYWLEG